MNQARNQLEAGIYLRHGCFFLGLLLDFEDGGHMFFRNVEKIKIKSKVVPELN
jgi:hypothetical protein